MPIHKLTAPIVFFPDDANSAKKVLVVDTNGKILAIDDYANHDPASIKHMPNAISAGFVNTHCHLELSHMKNLVATGTTLLPFIGNVVKYRDFSEDIIQSAIVRADEEMYHAGIVAVGDICNKVDTLATKVKSKIRYYSFIEMFDLMNAAMTPAIIPQYKEVYDAYRQNEKDSKSLVPHAPYSVTKSLFEYIRESNDASKTISIHNEETQAENDLFLDKSGGFIPFYAGFGNTLSDFSPTGRSAIHYAIENMDANQKTIFVHNTLTDASGIDAANAWSDKVYWATCPNANLYIENRLPNYRLFIEKNQRMTIGTDSLTSNWQLSVFEEIKTINKYCSYIPLLTLITWATANGAEALGYDNELGSIEVGKSPGLVSLPIVESEGKLHIVDGKEALIDVSSM